MLKHAFPTYTSVCVCMRYELMMLIIIMVRIKKGVDFLSPQRFKPMQMCVEKKEREREKERSEQGNEKTSAVFSLCICPFRFIHSHSE